MSDMKWLEEIERRNALRTQGKWRVLDMMPSELAVAVGDPDAKYNEREIVSVNIHHGQLAAYSNAEFITCAPQDITTLTKALRVAIGALNQATIALSEERPVDTVMRVAARARAALAEIERMGRDGE